MRFQRNADLPKGVQTAPDAVQSLFREAANQITADKPGLADERAFRLAWDAVRAKGWEQDEAGAWTQTAPVADAATTTVQVRETIALDAGSKPRRSNDGYMTAMPRVARSGIQLYGGDEVGRPSMDVVRVYRPEAEVFSKDSLASYAHKPVTLDHPPVLVTADNWAKYARGSLGDEVLRDQEFVRVPMVLMDAAAIRAVEDGQAQLSLGYTMDLKWQPGVTPSGEEYDAIQTKIRANHLAVVTEARGGPKLRIGDTSEGVDNMPTKQIVVDGLKCTMDERDADIVQRAIDKAASDLVVAQKIASDAKLLADETAKKLADATKAGEAKDAEIAALKKQLDDAKAASVVSPTKLAEMVRDRANVLAKAKAVLGDKLVEDGKTDAEIKRQVVDAKLGDVAKTWTVEQVDAAFVSFTADVKAGTVDPVREIIRNGLDGKDDDRYAAHDAYVDRLTNAWRGEQPTKQ